MNSGNGQKLPVGDLQGIREESKDEVDSDKGSDSGVKTSLTNALSESLISKASFVRSTTQVAGVTCGSLASSPHETCPAPCGWRSRRWGVLNLLFPTKHLSRCGSDEAPYPSIAELSENSQSPYRTWFGELLNHSAGEAHQLEWDSEGTGKRGAMGRSCKTTEGTEESFLSPVPNILNNSSPQNEERLGVVKNLASKATQSTVGAPYALGIHYTHLSEKSSPKGPLTAPSGYMVQEFSDEPHRRRPATHPQVREETTEASQTDAHQSNAFKGIGETKNLVYKQQHSMGMNFSAEGKLGREDSEEMWSCVTAETRSTVKTRHRGSTPEELGSSFLPSLSPPDIPSGRDNFLTKEVCENRYYEKYQQLPIKLLTNAVRLRHSEAKNIDLQNKLDFTTLELLEAKKEFEAMKNELSRAYSIIEKQKLVINHLKNAPSYPLQMRTGAVPTTTDSSSHARTEPPPPVTNTVDPGEAKINGKSIEEKSVAFDQVFFITLGRHLKNSGEEAH